MVNFRGVDGIGMDIVSILEAALGDAAGVAGDDVVTPMSESHKISFSCMIYSLLHDAAELLLRDNLWMYMHMNRKESVSTNAHARRKPVYASLCLYNFMFQ